MRRKRMQTFGSLVCPHHERLVRWWRYELQKIQKQIQIQIQSDPEWADSVQDPDPDQQTIFVYDNASRHEVDVAITDETNFSSTKAAGRRVNVDNVPPRPPSVLPHWTTTLSSTMCSLAVELQRHFPGNYCYALVTLVGYALVFCFTNCK